MNNNKNLYWPIYQSLENELLNITNYIKFEDNQINVYSDMLLNLLLRISIEIESISKDLYLKYGGETFDNEAEMYFDTVCLNYLENKWQLSKKNIQIVNPNMFFSERFSNLTPLKNANKRGSSGPKWKRAYQAIKHNRVENYVAGNLQNCINSLGALFILNVYYKDNTYKLSNLAEANNFDLSQGSKIFAITVVRGNSFDGIINNNPSAIYIINFSEKFLLQAKDNSSRLNQILINKLLSDTDFIDGIAKKKISLEEIGNFQKLVDVIGLEKAKSYYSQSLQKSNFGQLLSKQTFIAYLNKEIVDD